MQPQQKLTGRSYHNTHHLPAVSAGPRRSASRKKSVEVRIREKDGTYSMRFDMTAR